MAMIPTMNIVSFKKPMSRGDIIAPVISQLVLDIPHLLAEVEVRQDGNEMQGCVDG